MCVIYAYARSCNNRNAIDDTRPDENAYEYVIYFSLHIRSTKGESKAKEEEKKPTTCSKCLTREVKFNPNPKRANGGKIGQKFSLPSREPRTTPPLAVYHVCLRLCMRIYSPVLPLSYHDHQHYHPAVTEFTFRGKNSNIAMLIPFASRLYACVCMCVRFTPQNRARCKRVCRN